MLCVDGNIRRNQLHRERFDLYTHKY
jgi:hypothetical protein